MGLAPYRGLGVGLPWRRHRPALAGGFTRPLSALCRYYTDQWGAYAKVLPANTNPGPRAVATPAS